MAECSVLDTASYVAHLPRVPGRMLSEGEDRSRGLLSRDFTGENRRSLWSYVRGADSTLTLVERPSGWVAVTEPLESDLGYRILWGGHENVVTGQDLADMVTDGVLTVAEVCLAVLQVELVALTTDAGDPLTTANETPLYAAQAVGTPIALADAS